MPLLKFTFQGIDIDLVYARWDVPIIVDDDINIFSREFVGDQDTLLCLNGVRSTETIKKLIPNKKVFEKTLRIIKFWAQQRCIYSNVMGFLGGISWSIMTAKVCIENQDATNCVDILKRFFTKYIKWDEKEEDDENSARCIQLDHSLYDKLYDDLEEDVNGNCNEYSRNEFTEIMPILTPARPAMNCAYNVIGSTKHLIMQEIARGYDYTHYHELTEGGIQWSTLLQRRQFYDDTTPTPSMQDFEGENVYIQVECVPDEEMKHAKKWTGFIESNVRKLVKKLNRELFDSTFYPFATSFKNGNSDVFFISGKYNVDFDHRQNNEDMIEIVLQQFQNRIDISSVRFDCEHKCTMRLRVFQAHEIPEILRQISYPNGTPMGLADLRASHTANLAHSQAAPIFVHNYNLQNIQLITMPTMSTIPTALPFVTPYTVTAPPPLPGGALRPHPASHGRGSRGRGHGHNGHSGHNGGPPPHSHGSHGSHSVHGSSHRHPRHHHNHHHSPHAAHDMHGRRMRGAPSHHPRSRGGAPPRGRRSHYIPRGGGRNNAFHPPPRRAHAAQQMMNGSSGRGGGHMPYHNVLLSTPTVASTRDSLSDSPTPTPSGYKDMRMDPLHSKSRQNSVASHDSDSNESSTSGESPRNGGGVRSSNRNSDPLASIKHSPSQNGGGSVLSHSSHSNHGTPGPSPAPGPVPTGPPTPSTPSMPYRNHTMLLPSNMNMSQFPLLKIDPAVLPHLTPVVTCSNGSTSTNPNPLAPAQLNPRPGMPNNV